MPDVYPEVRLGDVADRVQRLEAPIPGRSYRQIGVRLWGEGAYDRGPIDGADTTYASLNKVESGDIIVNKIWARNGSVAVVDDRTEGCYGSAEFPVFVPKRDRLDPRWFHWYTKTRALWAQCDEKSRGTSGQNRMHPDRFLDVTMPMPSADEQKRVVGRIEAIAMRVEEARQLRRETRVDSQCLLGAAFHTIAQDAPRIALGEVAPLDRRPVRIDAGRSYPQIAVRSFGKGVFSKPPLLSDEITWQKPFLVRAGDILISNIKAWEGAIAVVGEEDDGRVASHRYLTFTPLPKVATARFLCFFLLTREGLEAVGGASPGSADRNRTLSAKVLQQTRVPVPPIAAQLWFDQLIEKVFGWRRAIDDVDNVLDAIMPSVLRRAFGGEL